MNCFIEKAVEIEPLSFRGRFKVDRLLRYVVCAGHDGYALFSAPFNFSTELGSCGICAFAELNACKDLPDPVECCSLMPGLQRGSQATCGDLTM